MKVLIAEDDFASRKVMNDYLSKFAECDIAIDGREAITAFNMALTEGDPYDLVCIHILIPELDGYEVLKTIRIMESENRIQSPKKAKVIFTSDVNESKYETKSFNMETVVYLKKPIQSNELEEELRKLAVI